MTPVHLARRALLAAALLAALPAAASLTGRADAAPPAAPPPLSVVLAGMPGGVGPKGRTASPLRVCPVQGRTFICGGRRLHTLELEGPVRVVPEPSLGRGLGEDIEIVQVLGRWPDQVFLVAQTDTRHVPFDRPEILYRWKADRWQEVARFEGGVMGLVQRYAFTGGQVVALVHEARRISLRAFGKVPGGRLLAELSALLATKSSPVDPEATCRGRQVVPRRLEALPSGELRVTGALCDDPLGRGLPAEERFLPGRRSGTVRSLRGSDLDPARPVVGPDGAQWTVRDGKLVQRLACRAGSSCAAGWRRVPLPPAPLLKESTPLEARSVHVASGHLVVTAQVLARLPETTLTASARPCTVALTEAEPTDPWPEPFRHCAYFTVVLVSGPAAAPRFIDRERAGER